MTSPVDRDARVLVSTFQNYEELGRAYWAEAAPKAKVTPEIAALAEEITKGLTDRRAQAEAISRWMKRNIRYVAVYLGAGRVVPHEASSVLKNKYGDCKDQVTLMTALLTAKGIASEQVLIQLGDAYTMPEPPTMSYLNHVMVYLPELQVYDDPTGSFASFGVLSASTYDKPVIHVSAPARNTSGNPPQVSPPGSPWRREAEQRLATELALIRRHDLAGFFLLHQEILELAREVACEIRGADAARGALPPGRGRGSSVPSRCP